MRYRVLSLLRSLARLSVVRGARVLWSLLNAPVHVQIMAVAIARGYVLSLGSKHFGQRDLGRVQLMKHVTLSRRRVRAWMIVLLWRDPPRVGRVALFEDRS